MSAEEVSKSDHRRLIVLALSFTFGFSVVVGQLFRYQVGKHFELKQEAIVQRDRERNVAPKRGYIADVNGYLLALDAVQWDISVSPPLVSDPDRLASDLAGLLNQPTDQLRAKITAHAQWVRLDRSVPQQVGEDIASLSASGLICEPRPKRVYPMGGLVAHVIGIVNDTGDGFYGVEGYYNPLLKGIPGKREIEQDAFGFELPIPPLAQSPPQAGTNLILTLDSNIQFIAEQELLRALDQYGAESGTVIVMEPRTGALLAIANHPTYDPNDFADVEPGLLRDPSVSSMWEPGSIFKIITWAAGLDSGTINLGTTFYDEGSLEVGGRIIENWDQRGHGLVTMSDGLIKSLNTVAAYISTSMGKDRFYTYLRRFGFGNLTKVDLASEGPGMVKLPGDSAWFPSELGTNSFGQGIAVTPMQMITAVAAVANRGLLMKPHIVHQLITEDEKSGEAQTVQVEPMVVRRPISQEAAETLTHLLVEVVEQGATEAQVPGYRIAGKTGTAQVPTAYGYHPTDTIASFVGYAPADDPQFVILVKLDKPQTSPWGTRTAAPTFRAIAERLFVYLQIPPDEIRMARR